MTRVPQKIRKKGSLKKKNGDDELNDGELARRDRRWSGGIGTERCEAVD